MFLFWGYNFMAAGIATTLHFTYPIFVTLFMLFVFKEKTSWITLLAIGLAICGVARLSIDGGESAIKRARRNHRITFRRRLCPLYRHRQ